MKNIMMDHFRRWWWVWVIGLVLIQATVIMACLPDGSRFTRQIFPVILFLGPFLLSFDLQRGHSRALLAMPVTVKETARAWWLATVAVPSLALAILTGLGYAIVAMIKPGSISYWAPLNHWLVDSLLLGFMFFALTGLPARPGGPSTGRERFRAYAFGALWGLSFASWVLFGNFLSIEKPVALAIYALAVILTVIGWFRAETMVIERAGLQDKILASPSAEKPWRGRMGYGGLRYLTAALFQRFMLMGLWMFLMCSVVFWFINLSSGKHTGQHTSEFADSYSFVHIFSFQLLWIMSFQILPVVFHLRVLRTLPVSSTRLAALLIFTPVAAMLLVMYLANLGVAAAYGFPWFSRISLFEPGYLVQIGLASCIVPVLIWRGMDRLGFLILIGMMTAGMAGMFALQTMFSSQVIGVVAPLLVLASFLITKYLLERSSRVYRPRNNQMPGWNWSVGR